MLSDKSQQIGDGVYSCGFIPRTTDFEQVSPSFLRKRATIISRMIYLMTAAW
ncbi:MAG: hypothetical protein U5N58_08855 [Actinomycetota bacterium]|nr:hypothetical protein [Actinomycetota bacterium]